MRPFSSQRPPSRFSPIRFLAGASRGGDRFEPDFGPIDLDTRQIVRDCIFIAAFLLVGSIHRYVMLALVVGLIPFALSSTVRAIKAIMIVVFVVYLNPVVNIQTGPLMIIRWVVFFAAWGKIYLDMFSRSVEIYRIKPILYLHIFCFAALVCNLMGGVLHPTAYLKLFSFALGATAILGGLVINSPQRGTLVSWVIAYSTILAVGSLPLTATPLGYFSKHRSNLLLETGEVMEVDEGLIGGFMGLLSHAQSFGTLAALLCIFVLVTAFFSRYTRRGWMIAIAGILFIMVVMSKARTGLMALIIATAATFVAAQLAVSRDRRVFKPFNLPIFPMIGGMAAVAVFAAATGVGPGAGLVQSFLGKGAGEETSLLSAYQGSRGALIERSLAVFQEHPLTGIGFGMDYELRYGLRSTGGGLLSWAYSPTEKGMILSAVLEETGIIGFLAFAGLVASFLFMYIKNANVYGFAVFSVIILLNMGEMNFFAVGGLGSLQWVMIGIATILTDKCTVPVARVGDRVRNPATGIARVRGSR